MTKYYAIMLNYVADSTVVNAGIEGALNVVTRDWLRYNAFQYLVESDREASAIYDAIRLSLPDKAGVLVIGVDIRDRVGTTSPMVAEWIKKHAP